MDDLKVFTEDIPTSLKPEYARLLGKSSDEVPQLGYSVMRFFERLAGSSFPQGVRQITPEQISIHPERIGIMKAAMGDDFDPYMMLRTTPPDDIRDAVLMAGPMFAAGVQLGADTYGTTPGNLVYTNRHLGGYIGYVRQGPDYATVAPDQLHANSLLFSVPKLTEVAMDLLIDQKIMEAGREIPFEQTKCYEYVRQGFEEMVHCMQETNQNRQAALAAQEKELYRMDSENETVRTLLAEAGYRGQDHPHFIRAALHRHCGPDHEKKRWFTQTDPREADAEREMAAHEDEIRETTLQLMINLAQTFGGPPL